MSYPFADRTAEDERLVAQARVFFDPYTRRLFQEAGLAPGMRVLDLGSGSGHVARLAAGLTGPDGRVVGIERDPEAVEMARRRTDAAGLADRVEFRAGDAQTLEGVEDGFDAVVGRLVIMYLPDPVAAIRRAASRVRPGGLVCLHEADLDYLWASPEPPLWSRVRRWFTEAMGKAGIEARMGPRLHAALRQAGLPSPRLLVEAHADGGPDAPAWGWASLVTGAAGLIERLGVATREEIDPPTLADRLLAELRAADGCVIGPPMTGAWATVPGA
ncbi:MAG: class I SAM-dependent methyltransferase [Nocardiopsaceae bacterium]|nr:class I SAM-dependent methyltransferase [Nocardiopsaceae bacterium]